MPSPDEIREHLVYWDGGGPCDLDLLVKAARAYADLLDKGEVVEEWSIGSVVDELDPDDIAAQVGDTFIDFRTMSPVEQWRRIADLLARVVPVEDDA